MTEFDPQLSGLYGLDLDHNYTDKGALGLRYLKPPPPGFNFDLLKDYGKKRSNYDRSNDQRDKLGNLVTWMYRHRNEVSTPGGFSVDIVCETGLLKSLLNLPYEVDNGKWKPKEQKFAASRYGGVVFIKRIDVRRSEQEDTPESYAGMLFEKLVTEKVDPNDACSDCFSVLKAQVGGHSLLYCCQVDCIKTRTEKPDQDDFVEIKTIPHYATPGSDPFGRNFSKKFWQQCAVSGTKEIYAGVRDQEETYVNGKKIVEIIHCDKVETLNVSELPDFATGWSPKDGVKMMGSFLSEVKRRVGADDPNFVLMITIRSKSEVRFDPMTSVDHAQFPVITPGMVDKLDRMTNSNDGIAGGEEAGARRSEDAAKERRVE